MIRVHVWAEIDGEDVGGRTVELVEGHPISLQLRPRHGGRSADAKGRVLVMLEPERFTTKEVPAT